MKSGELYCAHYRVRGRRVALADFGFLRAFALLASVPLAPATGAEVDWIFAARLAPDLSPACFFLIAFAAIRSYEAFINSFSSAFPRLD
jgi:hypothetical protein